MAFAAPDAARVIDRTSSVPYALPEFVIFAVIVLGPAPTSRFGAEESVNESLGPRLNGVGVCVVVGVGVLVVVIVGGGVPVGVEVAVALGVDVGVAVAEALAEGVALGVLVGVSVGVSVGV
jgi:hypothetical protein